MPRNSLSGDRTCVALIAPTVHRRVAVEDFAIDAGRWNTDAIAGAHDGREITYADQFEAARWRDTHEGDYVIVGIVGVDPLEARRLMIRFPQRGLGAVDAVEIANQVLHAAMIGPLADSNPGWRHDSIRATGQTRRP